MIKRLKETWIDNLYIYLFKIFSRIMDEITVDNEEIICDIGDIVWINAQLEMAG